MKKTAGFLASVFVISSLCLFAGCNQSDDDKSDTTTVEDSQVTESTNEQTVETTESTTETTEDNHIVDTLDISTSECEVRYIGIESGDRSLLESGFNDDINLDKVIMLKFEYTNQGNEPEQTINDYYITVYQNGSSLSEGSVSIPERPGNHQYDLWHNYIKSVLPGGTITYGVYYVLNDDSPITLYLDEWETGDYQIMELDVSNYVE